MTIVQAIMVADSVREVRLEPVGGDPLPDFTPGAHILCQVRLPNGDHAERAYSLVNGPLDRDAYVIAVANAENGAGGSAHLHGLAVKDQLMVARPKNDFPLSPSATSHLLLAGGIGITPILSMSRSLAQRHQPFELHYVGRRPGAMAYHHTVSCFSEATVICDNGVPSRGVDLAALLAYPRPGLHFYVCGPRPLIDAALSAARAQGWPDTRLHFELFGAGETLSTDTCFTVEVISTGAVLSVAKGQTILDVLIEAGLDPLFDCRRGECGICAVEVLGGVPEHRDMTLSQRERDSGTVICTCVSRAKTTRLTLAI